MTSRDLRVVASSPTVTSTLSPLSFTSSRESSQPHYNPPVNQLSRNSSSSSLDEDVQLMMSQSIAMLPLSSSHLSSTSGSMYQSAISTTHAQPVKADISSISLSTLQIAGNIDGRARPRHRVSVPSQDTIEDVLLSFGSQPIIFSLQIPSRRTQSSEQIPQADGDHSVNAEDSVRDKPEKETFQLTLTVGTLSCAFRSGHLRVLLDIVDACVPKPPTPSPVSRKDTSERPRAALCLEVNVVIRGIVMIALPEPAIGEKFSLDTFYERPLVPPRLPRTFLRLFLDALSFSFRIPAPFPDQTVSGTTCTSSFVPENYTISAQMVVSDVSLFAFHAVSSVDDLQVAAPILITDPSLPTLYTARHYRPSLASERPEEMKLPEFEVVDWTQVKLQRGSAKLSTWRSKNRTLSGKADRLYTPSQRPCDLPGSPDPFISSPLSEMRDRLPAPPAIDVCGRLVLAFPSKENSCAMNIKIAPLHLFFDLGMIFKDNLFVHFVEDIASAAIFTPRKTTDVVIIGRQTSSQQSPGGLSEDDADVERDVQIQQASPPAREREERKRLEALVLEDLDLGINYQLTGSSKPKSSPQQPVLLRRKVGALGHFPFSSLKTF